MDNEIMEEKEERKDFKSIENDLRSGLQNAENSNNSGPTFSSNVAPDKLNLVVPNIVVKLVCDIKNHIKIKIVTKDMDEDDKELIVDFLKTSDREILLYKMVLEEAGTSLTPENYKEFLNKWLCSSYILLIEFELESLIKIRGIIKNSNKKKTEQTKAA